MEVISKVCKKCNEEKPLTEFCKDKHKPDGTRKDCKVCHNKEKKASYNKNPDLYKQRVLQAYYKNHEKCKQKNREKIKSEEYKQYRKQYRENNKQAFVEYDKKSYNKRRDVILEQKKEYSSLNRDKINKSRKHKLKNDPNFKIACNIRTRLNGALKNNSKKSSSLVYLGCSIEEYKIYLESKFIEGMTWENHGEWHIDHIIPICNFDLSIEENIYKAFNYLNTQPLWAEDNLRKQKKINI